MEKLAHMRKAILALLVLAAFSYSGAVNQPFVHDDVVFILQNPQVHDFKTITQVFDKSSFTAGTPAFANPYYRPFLDIVYRLEFFFFGPSPVGYHLVNILLHVVNAVLIMVLTLRLTQRQGFAWCVAALFLVHPIQSEAVACISGISNLLFTTFLLLSFLQYMHLTVSEEELSLTQEAVQYGSVLLLFGAALLTKEQALVLPIIILFYEYFLPQLSGHSNTGWRLRMSGLVIVAGGYLLWRKLILGGFLTSLIPNWGEFYLRLKSLPAIIMTHLRTLFWPADLHYYRSHDILAPWVLPLAALACFVMVCLLIGRILPSNRKTIFGFGLGWFFITLAPTTSIVPLIHEYSFIAAFEHFNYLPLAGLLWSFLIAAEYFLEKVFHKRSLILKKICLAVIIPACVAVTFLQTKVWAGEIPLFEQAVKYEPEMGRLRLLLAKAYYFHKDFKRAEPQFGAARDIMSGYLAKVKDVNVRPFYESFLKESLLGLASCSEAIGDLPSAEKYYDDVSALAPSDSMVWNNLGVIAIRQGQVEKAMVHFKKALAVDPGFAPARHNLELLSR
ncbi:MAG: tetratricopeptide repeat protein [Candidatus Omnitrophica bacterium]|nr:tetratricopeptide repeat protein [Candidatus Omnitrophota bacterium]